MKSVSVSAFFKLNALGVLAGMLVISGLSGCSGSGGGERDDSQESSPYVSSNGHHARKHVAVHGVKRSGPAQMSVATGERLSYAALDRCRHHVTYDGEYFQIGYPNGDVPGNVGVCTDTVIRSYRRLGVDLQSLVHEDMENSFYSYPRLAKWGLNAPDPNIDHRRVPNLKAFFARHGASLPVTGNARDYHPGDLVTWNLGGDQEHIGIVVDRVSSANPERHLVVHNIGDGEKLEDVLFTMPISGHYRYFPRVASRD